MAEAAPYREVYEEISKILECGICMNQLHTPKVLHCQHSFCKNCIDNILQFKPDGSADITCPFRCAGLTTIGPAETTADLKSNFQLLGIVDMYTEKTKRSMTMSSAGSTTTAGSGGYACHTCSAPVSIYCSKCNEFYCTKCEREEHRQHPSTSVVFDDSHDKYMPVCREHNALASVICCKQIICVYCQHRKHRSHLHHERLTTHAENIRRLFRHPDTQVCKMEQIMTNAKANYDKTLAAMEEMKTALVSTLKGNGHTPSSIVFGG